MKWTLMFSAAMLVAVAGLYGQKYQKISEIPPVWKGKILLQDGTTVQFRNLTVSGDTVVFRDAGGNRLAYTEKDVYKVVKQGNYAAMSAVSCGLGGLLGSVLGTLTWTESPLKEKKGTYILVTTGALTVIGGLVGLAVKRDVILYKNPAGITLAPALLMDHRQRMATGLTCRIPIR